MFICCSSCLVVFPGLMICRRNRVREDYAKTMRGLCEDCDHVFAFRYSGANRGAVLCLCKYLGSNSVE